MASIGEASKAYVPPTTNNITDLDMVDVSWELNKESFMATKKDKDGNDFKEEVVIEVVEVAGIKFRVPTSVKKQLKAQLKANPDLKYFRVNKEGSGLSTEYTVIPLLNKDQVKNKPEPSPAVVEEVKENKETQETKGVEEPKEEPK